MLNELILKQANSYKEGFLLAIMLHEAGGNIWNLLSRGILEMNQDGYDGYTAFLRTLGPPPIDDSTFRDEWRYNQHVAAIEDIPWYYKEWANQGFGGWSEKSVDTKELIEMHKELDRKRKLALEQE